MSTLDPILEDVDLERGSGEQKMDEPLLITQPLPPDYCLYISVVGGCIITCGIVVLIGYFVWFMLSWHM
jgi:hypothetical protein